MTSAAEGCYARLSLTGRDFKMLSRLEVKHAKKSPRSVKDRVIMRNRTAATPSAKTAKHPQEKLDYARHHEMATASGNIEI